MEWLKLYGRVTDWSNLHEISKDIMWCYAAVYVYLEKCMNCYESALLDGWMKENACKIIDSAIEPW